MSSKTDKPDQSRAKGAGDKAARLAEALRANLHRRKQQARARAEGQAAEAGMQGNPPDHGNGNEDKA